MEFQKEELNEILNIFQQESFEIISSMDTKLLMLEKENNPELAMQLFRDAHSLKGSARMLGFDDIQNIAHKIEDIISLVKENKLTITGTITDTISECLEFISMLIENTVIQKEEFKSPDYQKYIQKLEYIAKNYQNEERQANIEEETDPYKKDFLSKFDNMEELIISILYSVSSARKSNDFNCVYNLDEPLKRFISLIRDNPEEKIQIIKQCANNLLNVSEKFKKSENKEYSFLELNNSLSAFIENFTNYLDREHIKRKDYYEIVIEKLSTVREKEEKVVPDVKNAELLKTDKLDEIMQRLPLMELNCDFYPEAIEIIANLALSAVDGSKKQIYQDVKDILSLFKEKKLHLTHDVSMGIKEVLSSIKGFDKEKIKDALTKIEVIKTLSAFQQKDNAAKANKSNVEQTQKDILNTITNTEIKTLRVDSVKLDNLVGQIGELIVSKIKTNEQLSLAKKISIDLSEWQKNFSKMNYYIKYFDKKYLSNPTNGTWDYRKIIAYNKQLCTLGEQHSEKITALIKEMQLLYKQLQESETKLNSTTTEIETMVKNMRILPLSTIFQLFPRMVHNIARDKNKKIDLIIEGADITADKTIIEEIKIPLMHIIRNSIDHGIEDVETRKMLGKNPTGRIEIIASHKDDKVIIDVKDDGRGLDIEKIKSKALEKKILTQEELNAISDEELTNLIFYPGFSTEDFVTELSGRGLGLDIVNSKINQMQGRIDIFSQVNKGTIVRITLPATVATKKVFIIEEQKELFAIETSVIKTIARINSDDIFEKDNKSYFIYNGAAVVLYSLSQILNFKDIPKETNKYTIMIIETENTIFGVIVEKLISDQEIVHKKLAAPLYKVKHISGITTLANGEACLILNISDIISTLSTKKTGVRIISETELLKTRDNSKYKILIVDDSHTTRILQKNILSSQGYNVSTATNPLNALEKIKDTKFDLIVSDVQMPEMNGFDFVRELRKNKNYENFPVIIVSSEPIGNHIKDIEETRVVRYIQKNVFKQEELFKCIESILNY